jgi:hypothetical protein
MTATEYDSRAMKLLFKPPAPRPRKGEGGLFVECLEAELLSKLSGTHSEEPFAGWDVKART